MSGNQHNKKNSDESFLYTGRIREIEVEIVRFQLDLARSNSQSETLQKILSSLLLHQKLTQSQIKVITNLSKSTISTGLSNLMNIGHIRKKRIPGSREYLYFVTSSYVDSINNAFGSLEKEIQFLKNELSVLSTNCSKDQKGYSLLSYRISEIIRVFELYQMFLEKLTNDEIVLEKEDPTKKITLDDIHRVDEIFDPEIKKIEDDIIDFFSFNSAYSTMDELFLEIYVYFFTRNVLTQEKIRQLTGLSLGKVSQIIGALIEMNAIEELDKVKMHDIIPENKSRQKIYSMNSIQISFFKSALNSGNNILKSYNHFKSLRDELKIKKSKLKNRCGYNEVLQVLENYFKLMGFFDKSVKIFRDLI